MAELVAHFTNQGVPLISPANPPTIRIRRTDTGVLVVTDVVMTELGDGNFRLTFVPSATLEYSIRADGDPIAAGQVTVAERYVFGALSGIQEAQIETSIPDIQARLPAALVGGRMASNAEVVGDKAGYSVAGLTPGLLDVPVSSRLAAGSYVAPDNATIASTAVAVTAVKVKTDELTFAIANVLNVNVTWVNSFPIKGDGTIGNEWGPL